MNLGGPEILVIIVVAVLVLGPDKLPNALRMFGRTMGEIRKYQDLAKTEIEKAMNSVDESPSEDIETDSSVVQESKNSGETLDLEPESAGKSSLKTSDPEIVEPILDDEEQA